MNKSEYNQQVNQQPSLAELQQRAYEKLVFNLEEMTKHYRQLLECVRKEKELLIKSDIPTLNDNNIHKEQCLVKIKSLDGLRINYAVELAQLIGADYREPRLLDMAKRVSNVQADKLRALHATLEIVTKRVAEINCENESLAQSALKTVNSAMNNIKESLGGKKVYQKKGTVQGSNNRSGNFISKEG